MEMQIRLDDLSDPRIAAFLQEHIRDMRAVSPPQSKHALDLEGLKRPEIRFWSGWIGPELVACAALKQLDATHGELKSMRTSSGHRRQGLAQAMLLHVLERARSAGLRRVSLETGSMPFFEPARRLYQRHGFVPCEPFADYRPDPNSVFLTRVV